MNEYNKDNENLYWNGYYKAKTTRLPNSEFSEFVLNKINKFSSLIDIGCGDGRDTYFFSKNEIYTKGVDFSLETIEQNNPFSNKYLSFEHLDLSNIDKLNKKFDFGYCRFIFHSINVETEDILLKWLKNNVGYKVFIETRVFDPKNLPIEENHYRRFFSEESFIKKIKDLDFKILLSESSYQFSKYKDIYKVNDIKFDPLILRMIIST